MASDIYQCFGFHLRSAFVLPELPKAPAGSSVDVVVRAGETGGGLGGVFAEPGILVEGSDCLLFAPTVRMRVRGGVEIVVQPEPGVDEADVRPFLLGAGLAVLCHQRGLLPLHASAIALGEGLVAFAGPSGVGKSTLAAALQAAGLPAVCDDLCALSVGEDRIAAACGPTRLKLTPESLRALGTDPAGVEPVGAGAGKHLAPMTGRPSVDVFRPLERLYVLRRDVSDPPAVRQLAGAHAFSAVLSCVHRWPTARAMGLAGRIFEDCLALAGACTVLEVGAAPDLAALGSRAACVLSDLGV